MPLIPLNRLLLGLCLTGLICGTFLTALQLLDTLPQLLDSERFEQRLNNGQTTHGLHPSSDNQQRAIALGISNLLFSTGHSALLLALLYLHGLKTRREADITTGFLAGVLGYLLLFALPANLSPPSTVAGDLLRTMTGAETYHLRIWLLVVAVNIAGMALLFWHRRRPVKFAAATLILTIQILSPPSGFEFPAYLNDMTVDLVLSAEARYRFSLYLTNLLYWLLLGSMASITLRCLQRTAGLGLNNNQPDTPLRD